MRQRKALPFPAVAMMVLLGMLVVFSAGCSEGHRQQPVVREELPHHEHPAAHGDEGDREHAEEPVLSGDLVDGVRVIKVAARKFEFDPATIVVREGEAVRLEVTSEDVPHGISIEGYEINRKLKRGQTETIIFTADKPGRHHFHCSVYCGSGHRNMHGELVVLSSSP